MKTTMMLAVLATAFSLTGTAMAASDIQSAGVNGNYEYLTANASRVRYFAVTYNGNYRTVADAEAATDQAVAWAKNHDYSAAVTGQQYYSLSNTGRLMVLGYVNLDSDASHYISITSDGSELFYRVDGGSTQRCGYGEWCNQYWRSQGSQLRVQFGQDGQGGGVTWGFHRPTD